MQFKLFIIGLLFAVVVTFPIAIFAQSTDVNTPNLSSTPATPSQFEEVTMRVTFPLINITSANIRWLLDGDVQAEYTGEQSFTFATGALGSINNVRVEVTSRDGRFYSTTKTIRPANIDIVWEAKTTIPPFYKGKALPSPESSIRVIALPTFITSNGMMLPPSELFYTWKVNGTVLRGLPTKGQQVITVETPLLSDTTSIDVRIESPGGSIIGRNQTSIRSVSPEIVLYEENPLRGVMYENALMESFELTKNEIILFAENFYFSIGDTLRYEWTADGNIAIPDAQNNKRLTVLKNLSGSFGKKTDFKVKVTNMNKIRQVIEKVFAIRF